MGSCDCTIILAPTIASPTAGPVVVFWCFMQHRETRFGCVTTQLGRGASSDQNRCFCCSGPAGLQLRVSLSFVNQLDLELVEMDSARRSVQEVRIRRHRTGPQLQRALGHSRLDLLGHDLASRLSIRPSTKLATAPSLLHTGGPDFHTEIDPPNEPARVRTPSP